MSLSIPTSGIILSNTFSITPDSASVIFLALRRFQSSVVIRFDATTLGLSRLATGTSVFAPRTLVLMGQQISRPVALLYAFPDSTRAGRYLPISFPRVGSKSSQMMSLRSGTYILTSHPQLCGRWHGQLVRVGFESAQTLYQLLFREGELEAL